MRAREPGSCVPQRLHYLHSRDRPAIPLPMRDRGMVGNGWVTAQGLIPPPSRTQASSSSGARRGPCRRGGAGYEAACRRQARTHGTWARRCRQRSARRREANCRGSTPGAQRSARLHVRRPARRAREERSGRCCSGSRSRSLFQQPSRRVVGDTRHPSIDLDRDGRLLALFLSKLRTPLLRARPRPPPKARAREGLAPGIMRVADQPVRDPPGRSPLRRELHRSFTPPP
jgi:hypothetical protein